MPRPRGRIAARAARAAMVILKFAVYLLAACFLVFCALDLLPGNAATQQLGFTGTTEQIQALMHEWGLDLPLIERFASWLTGAASGDLGEVFATGRPVADALIGPLSRTAAMFCLAFLAVAIVGTGLGVLAGLRSGRASDRAVSTAALIVRSMPEFVVALVLVLVFATCLKVLPAVSLAPVGASAFSAPEIFVLPTASIALVGMSSVIRPVRAVVARENAEPYVEAARLAGVPERRVVLRHLLPSCAAPIAQALASVVPYLIGGAVIVECVFNFPGIGTLMVSAVQNREPNVLMACTLVMVSVSLVAYWLADALLKEGENDA